MNLAIPNHKEIKESIALIGGGNRAVAAKRIGVTTMTISHWITGKRSPSKRHLKKMMELLK